MAAAEASSITRAAERPGCTAPALSQHLVKQERTRRKLAQPNGLSGGTLNLGTFRTVGTRLLPPVLGAFRGHIPTSS